MRSTLLTFSAAALVTLLVILLSQVAAASSLYVCRDERGKKFYSNMPESGRCQSMSTPKLGSMSLSNKWPGYSSTSYKDVRYHNHIDYWSKRYNIDPNLIKAIIRAESGFDRYAVSKKGAQGLMQLMPATAREMRVSDPFNPEQNIAGGVRYLRKLLKMFNGDVVLSLAAYNAGPGQVKRAGGVPGITETKRYIKRVLSYYQRYAKA
jgi:soluble lytic murein transglycosylase-like protein